MSRQSPFLSTPLRLLLSILFLIAGVAIEMPPRKGETAAMRHSPLTPGRQGPTDPRELEAFLDMFFAETLRRDHIPGAAIIVVKDGQILLSNSPPG